MWEKALHELQEGKNGARKLGDREEVSYGGLRSPLPGHTVLMWDGGSGRHLLWEVLVNTQST